MVDFTDRKEFEKLSQLDRIEYMLKRKRIQEKYEWGLVFWMIRFFIIVCAILFLFITTGYSAFGESFAISLSKKIPTLYYAFIICIIISLISDIINIILGTRAKSKLNKQFFKIEVKKK